MSFFGSASRVTENTEAYHSYAEQQSERYPCNPLIKRTEGIQENPAPNEQGKDRTGGLDGFRGQREASKNGKHDGEPNQVKPERSPIATAGADTDFTKKPRESKEVKKTEGERIHAERMGQDGGESSRL